LFIDVSTYKDRVKIIKLLVGKPKAIKGAWRGAAALNAKVGIRQR
jgi:hypothetical protein